MIWIGGLPSHRIVDVIPLDGGQPYEAIRKVAELKVCPDT